MEMFKLQNETSPAIMSRVFLITEQKNKSNFLETTLTLYLVIYIQFIMGRNLFNF